MVELSHTDPSSQAQMAPVRGETALDLVALRDLQLQPEAYGAALAAQLFDPPQIRQRFTLVETAAQAGGSWLRISLRFEPSAQDLQGLRWELLRHPITGAELSTSEHTLLSRFMVSTDWRPVHLRARADLRALVAVSAPPADALARARLAPVDLEGEINRSTSALRGVQVQTLGGPGAPCTLNALVEAARGGVDILYLVSHGTFKRSTGAPSLFFQDEAGGLAVVDGQELASRLGAMQGGPRLVVLASCQSAGDGEAIDPEHRGTVQSTLAARLADAGVPAVIAMQGLISMETVERMMPLFFKELLEDGQIDRALAAARARIRDRADRWMPALFLRLTNGRIWYTPGFGSGSSSETWKRLIPPVQRGKLVPILGPGLLDRICGTHFLTARQLALKEGFPLAQSEWDDLPRVTQYLAVKESRFNVVRTYQAQLVEDLRAQHCSWLGESMAGETRLAPLLNQVAKHNRETDPDDPYQLIAALPASVYVTTNFDPVLSAALSAAERKPTRVLTRWRYKRRPEEETRLDTEISQDRPLVFHALGAFGKDTDDTLVLTEDDYFDYLIGTASDRLMPPEVESALVDNALLFLGFRLTDWSFRVLFRLIMSLPGKERLKQYCHVAVQVDPDLHNMSDIEGAKAYLAKYFDAEANIDIYWGTPRDFLIQLRDELARAGAPTLPPSDEAEEGWDF